MHCLQYCTTLEDPWRLAHNPSLGGQTTGGEHTEALRVTLMVSVAIMVALMVKLMATVALMVTLMEELLVALIASVVIMVTLIVALMVEPRLKNHKLVSSWRTPVKKSQNS